MIFGYIYFLCFFLFGGGVSSCNDSGWRRWIIRVVEWVNTVSWWCVFCVGDRIRIDLDGFFFENVFFVGEFRIDLDGFFNGNADVHKFSRIEGTIEEVGQAWHKFAKTCGEVSEEEMKGGENGGHVWLVVEERWFSYGVDRVLGEASVVKEPIAKVVCASF